MAVQPRTFLRSARTLVANMAQSVAERARPAGSEQAHPLPPSQTKASEQQMTAAQLLHKSHVANQQPFNRPTNIPGVVAPEIDQVMQENKAPQDTFAGMFPPGAPLPTVPEIESPLGPRAWQYPVGYNIAAQPRSSESTSFSQLRNLALLYEGVQLCETVYFDILSRLVPKLKFKPNVIPVGESDQDEKWRAIMEPAEHWLAYPDGEHNLYSWLTASARDVLELGWSAIYKQRDRLGRIISLDLVDTATIKPLLDQRGRRPFAPFPAYSQYIYGIPGGRYGADEITMIQETARSDSIYPFSRVERIIMRINMALRKEALDLSRFTDGSVPEGMIFPDAHTNWTPAQIEEYERVFNGLLSGNDRYRVRVKFGPPGSKFVNTRPSDPMMEFDSYLLNVTVAVFGLTMDEIAMTQDSNRSVGQTQQDVIYRRVIEPLAQRYAAFLTEVIQEIFDDRLVLTWGGIEEQEDRLVKAQVLDIGVKNGSLAPSRMAEMMGWPVDVKTGPFVLTKEGIEFLEDALSLRESKVAAEEAVNEAKTEQPELALPGGGRQPQEGTNASQTPQGKGASTAPKQAQKQQKSGSNPAAQRANQPQDEHPSASLADLSDTRTVTAEALLRGITLSSGFVGYDLHTPAQVIQPGGDPCTCEKTCFCRKSGTCTPPCPCACDTPKRQILDQAVISGEYRRWRKVALRAVTEGRHIPDFRTSVIPPEDHSLLSMELAHCSSPEDVRGAFLRAKARQG